MEDDRRDLLQEEEQCKLSRFCQTAAKHILLSEGKLARVFVGWF